MEIRRELESVAAEWEALAERVGASPFLRPGWFAAFARAFNGGRWEIYCLRRGGRLAAVLPLRRRNGILASPTNWHTPEFGALAEDETAAAELIDLLLEDPPRRLDLSFLDGDDPVAEMLREATEAHGLYALERVIERSPYVDLDGDWSDFEARLPSRRRSDLRRRRRRLDEQGRVEIAAEPLSDDFMTGLADGFAVEASGWKGEEGTAIASDRATRGFYEDLAVWAAARGWLELWFARLDGRPIAFAYCLVHDRVHYLLKVGFDPAYKRFAPGTLLTREMLVRGFESDRVRFEFLGQPDPHKLVWTDRCHDRLRLQVFAPSPAGIASRALWEFGRPVAKRALETIRA